MLAEVHTRFYIVPDFFKELLRVFMRLYTLLLNKKMRYWGLEVRGCRQGVGVRYGLGFACTFRFRDFDLGFSIQGRSLMVEGSLR